MVQLSPVIKGKCDIISTLCPKKHVTLFISA